jgi:hypothetical protein
MQTALTRRARTVARIAPAGACEEDAQSCAQPGVAP